MAIDKSILGVAGEFAVAAELCRWGMYAQLTLGQAAVMTSTTAIMVRLAASLMTSPLALIRRQTAACCLIHPKMRAMQAIKAQKLSPSQPFTANFPLPTRLNLSSR
jgi:hypothetical protein